MVLHLRPTGLDTWMLNEGAQDHDGENYRTVPQSPADSGPSEIHILPWAEEIQAPTLWQRFMAWLKGK